MRWARRRRRRTSHSAGSSSAAQSTWLSRDPNICHEFNLESHALNLGEEKAPCMDQIQVWSQHVRGEGRGVPS